MTGKPYVLRKTEIEVERTFETLMGSKVVFDNHMTAIDVLKEMMEYTTWLYNEKVMEDIKRIREEEQTQ